MKKKFLILLALLNSSIIYASEDKYTISVCMTSNMENALTCKKRITNNMEGDVFIVKNKNNKFFTYINVFDDKEKGKQFLKTSSEYVKQQKPYVKVLDKEIVDLKNLGKNFIDLNDEIKKTEAEPVIDKKVEKVEEPKKEEKSEIPLVASYPATEDLKLVSSYHFNNEKKVEKVEEPKKEEKKEEVKADETHTNNDLKFIEEIRKVSMDEVDKAAEIEKKETKKVIEKPIAKEVEKEHLITPKETVSYEQKDKISDYEQIVIEVDSITNMMTVKAKIDNELKDIKTYRVSTGKKNVKKPLGDGKISLITINPIWYPTEDTLKSFRKKGIYLPNVVPPGHKYNYMGAAKINLTHIVNGKNTFRIHGTLNENTIGTNESAGCIRMKNNEVVQLATLLNDFSNVKSMNDIKVVLK